jgi:hypothetical protein
LKALLGLGPSLFAAVYHALLAPDAATLLLLLALAPAFIVGICSGMSAAASPGAVASVTGLARCYGVNLAALLLAFHALALLCLQNMGSSKAALIAATYRTPYGAMHSTTWRPAVEQPSYAIRNASVLRLQSRAVRLLVITHVESTLTHMHALLSACNAVLLKVLPEMQNNNSSSNSRRFTAVYVIIALLALNQLLASLLQSSSSSSGSKRAPFSLISAGCLLLAVGVAAVKPLWQQQQQTREQSQVQQPGTAASPRTDNNSNGISREEQQSLLGKSTTHHCDISTGSSTNSAQGTGQGGFSGGDSANQQPSHSSSSSSSLSGVVRSREFWLIFYVFAVGVGAGLAFTNNLPEIVAAFEAEGPTKSNKGLAAAAAAAVAAAHSPSDDTAGPSAAEVTVQLVSLFSIGSCFGR